MNFTGFKVERVLSQDARTKSCAILGRFKDAEGRAIVLLSRASFAPDSVQGLLASTCCYQELFKNDVYTKYLGAVLLAPFNNINIDVIFPATEQHISKHSTQAYEMVEECHHMYAKVTLPFIEAIPASRLEWVRNVLDKKAEVEQLIFEDPDEEQGFMLHPDMKWDQSQVDSLYCIALCVRRDLRSLRDLNESHLPLLNNIRAKCREAVLERYGVRGEQLRMFLHYPPSYFHLHVHVTHVELDCGPSMAAGKAHLLDDVIDNIRFVPNYYACRSLTYPLGDRDPLKLAILKVDAEQDARKAASETAQVKQEPEDAAYAAGDGGGSGGGRSQKRRLRDR